MLAIIELSKSADFAGVRDDDVPIVFLIFGVVLEVPASGRCGVDGGGGGGGGIIVSILQSSGCGSTGGGGGGGGAILAANAAYDFISAEIGSVTVGIAGTTIAAIGSFGVVKLAIAGEITICDDRSAIIVASTADVLLKLLL